jgi:NAD(P)H-dependent flavin oxidoreductase YrpB (nitropropane dioxygenase family)
VDLLDRLRIDVPVAQAGMGDGIAGVALAGAVSEAGGLGTLGLAPPAELGESIRGVRERAPGRAVAVNFLMPFLRRRHVAVCLDNRIDVAVLAFGGSHELVRQLHESRIFVLALVGTEDQVSEAVEWGADGLIAQGREAGGHLVGTEAALEFLPRALARAGGRPVFLAGGIGTGADTRAACAAGASGVVAGTRFLMTHESGAHPEYQRRVGAAHRTIETTLFGLGWPARHRVVPNAATKRWCRDDGTVKRAPAAVNARSSWLARLPTPSAGSVLRLQRPSLPLFTPLAPTKGMPDTWVDRAALYAGESGLRINDVTSAREAVAELSGR